MSSRDSADPQAAAFRLHLLDVGREKYADSILIDHFGQKKKIIGRQG